MTKAPNRKFGEGQGENRQTGLWIDHKQAIVVSVKDGREETSQMPSNMEKHVRYSKSSESEDGSADDPRDKQYMVHLNQFYDRVISNLGKTTSVLIMGPGEAKKEFADRLAMTRPNLPTVAVETVDKMTQPQIVAHVRGNS